MLGKRNLHASLTTNTGSEDQGLRAMKWLLNLSDGEHDLIAVAARSGIPFRVLIETAALLQEHDLLKPLEKEQHAATL